MRLFSILLVKWVHITCFYKVIFPCSLLPPYECSISIKWRKKKKFILSRNEHLGIFGGSVLLIFFLVFCVLVCFCFWLCLSLCCVLGVCWCHCICSVHSWLTLSGFSTVYFNTINSSSLSLKGPMISPVFSGISNLIPVCNVILYINMAITSNDWYNSINIRANVVNLYYRSFYMNQIQCTRQLY